MLQTEKRKIKIELQTRDQQKDNQECKAESLMLTLFPVLLGQPLYYNPKKTNQLHQK